MQEVTFTRVPNYQKADERGWTYDRVYVFVNNVPAGHISISYIPKEVFDNTYFSTLHWLWISQGHCFTSSDNHSDFKNWSLEELQEFIRGVKSYGRYWNDPCPDTIESCLSYIADKNKKFTKLYKEKIAKWKAYHVDHPEASFVLVEPEFRRKGLGTQLYKEASAWMKERGLRFYASTLQTPEAQGLWAFLDAKNMVAEEDGRRYVVPA